MNPGREPMCRIPARPTLHSEMLSYARSQCIPCSRFSDEQKDVCQEEKKKRILFQFRKHTAILEPYDEFVLIYV